ncbi:HEAT repeat domain-containing protein [Chryseobacterium sp. 2987]|uniref:HEAT repeat domain-containing protein n=1 Tax=Chryseobacterium sp. 2987 TaxID=2817767 RepID=UPI00285B7431|nr:HEAT repeat domain-containing protein [Chryseobacterium sp. 2987]MDR6920039.1 HEAT repeat protein [Chryseobacterium sp. 2987]
MQDLNEILLNLKSNDSEVIEKALDDLAQSGYENSLELILPFLRHHSKEVRETAVFNLGEIKDEKAITYIIDTAKNEEESVRMFAILALDNYRSDAILKVLLEEVKRPKVSASPKQRAAEQLKNYPCKEAQEALIFLILNDENPYIFIPAADSLYSMNDKDLLDLWKKIDTSYNHDYVNSVARKAIEDIENNQS